MGLDLVNRVVEKWLKSAPIKGFTLVPRRIVQDEHVAGAVNRMSRLAWSRKI